MRILDPIATVGAWTWFVLIVVIFDPVLRIARLCGEGPMDRAVSLMCRLLALCIPMGMGRLVIDGLEHVPRNGRVVVVANHQSLVENFLPLWVLDHLRPRYVAKREMARWIPSVSFNLRAARHCIIDRGDRERSLAAISQLGGRVRDGEASAMIFPEGTRSATGEMRPFRRAGLVALLEAAPQAAVLPVVFCGGNRIFPRGFPRVQAGSTVRMRVLPLLERQGRSLDELVDTVAELLSREFERLSG